MRRLAIVAAMACGKSADPPKPPPTPIDAAPVKALPAAALPATPAWAAIAKQLPAPLLVGAIVADRMRIAACRATTTGAIACGFSPIATHTGRVSGSEPPWPVEQHELLSADEAKAFDAGAPAELQATLAERIAKLRGHMTQPVKPLFAVCDLTNTDGTNDSQCEVPIPEMIAGIGNRSFAVSRGRTYAGAIFVDMLPCDAARWRARVFVDEERSIIAGVVEVEDADCKAEPRAVVLR